MIEYFAKLSDSHNQEFIMMVVLDIIMVRTLLKVGFITIKFDEAFMS
jgi:hypothetical protein